MAVQYNPPAPLQYAIARQLNPSTGDVAIVDGLWVNGVPLTEVVLRTLRTARGSYLPNPLFGLDVSVVQKASPNASAMFDKAIRAALFFLTNPTTGGAQLTKLQIKTEVQGNAILADIAFVDPRTGAQLSVSHSI